MDRITRKELKADKFREEVAHTFEYVETHRKQVVRYGAVALAAILAFSAYTYISRQKSAQRQAVLHAAMEVLNRPVGAPGPNDLAPPFPTAEERAKAASKALNDVINQFPGSGEAQVSHYLLGGMAAEAGKLNDAEKYLKLAADGSDKNYASLAAFSLAHVEKSLGKTAEAEKLMRALMAKPTVFVSQEQATIALAKIIRDVKPNEARKLLEPLRTSKRSAVSRSSLTTLAEFPPQ